MSTLATRNAPAAPEAMSPADLAAVRRALRVRLLKDLVSNGLYEVRADRLADRLAHLLDPDAG